MNKHAWLDAVVTHPKTTARDIAVAAVIYKHYNEKTGKCWPSQQTIADHISQKKTTGAAASLKALKAYGLLDWTQGRKDRSNTYRILTPAKVETVEFEPIHIGTISAPHVIPAISPEREAAIIADFERQIAEMPSIDDDTPPAEAPDDIVYEDVPPWAAEYDEPTPEPENPSFSDPPPAHLLKPSRPKRELVTAGGLPKPWFSDNPPF